MSIVINVISKTTCFAVLIIRHCLQFYEITMADLFLYVDKSNELLNLFLSVAVGEITSSRKSAAAMNHFMYNNFNDLSESPAVNLQK
jgi:hypothetical protein